MKSTFFFLSHAAGALHILSLLIGGFYNNKAPIIPLLGISPGEQLRQTMTHNLFLVFLGGKWARSLAQPRVWKVRSDLKAGLYRQNNEISIGKAPREQIDGIRS